MARSTQAGKTSFSAGELSPELSARVDIEQYRAGCQDLTNFIAKPLGPARKRNGSKYVAEVKDSTKEVRLKRFQTRVDQAFILEFGNLYIRFYADNAQVVETSKNITAITNANPGVVTSNSHGFSNGDQIYIDSVGGTTQLNGLRFTVAGVTANTFELSGINTTSYGVYTSGGTATRIYTLVSPYSDTEVQSIQTRQVGDTVYIAHPSYETRRLTRVTNTSWTLDTLDATCPGTIENGYAPALTLTPTATTGTGINFTASGAVFLDGDIGREIQNLGGSGRATITALTSSTVVVATITETFPSTSAIASGYWLMALSPVVELTPTGVATKSIISISADTIGTASPVDTFRTADIGRFIFLNGGCAKILAITSASDVSCIVVKELESLNETKNWSLEESAWSSTYGYPKAVAFHKGRLWLAGTTLQPDVIRGSAIGDYANFAVGPNDSDAVSYTLSASQPCAIQWLASSRDLIVGTSNCEIGIAPGPDGLLTSSSVDTKVRTYIGSQGQEPTLVDNKVLFIQGNQKQYVTFSYKYEIDGYEGVNLLLLAEHLGDGILQESCYARQPNSLLYVITEAGKLLCGSYLDSVGWSEFETDGLYESVNTISSSNEDQVWVAVKRTINGSTKRYIEYFDNGSGEEEVDGFLDSYLSYSQPKTVTAITKANPAVVTSTSHGFSNGNTVKFNGVLGMTQVNGITYTVANVTANTFELSGINSTAYGTFVSGNVYKLVTTISNLYHLEGETVSVKTDNAAHPDVTVSSGSITLQFPAREVVVGIPYNASISTLAATFSGSEGEMSGQRIRRVSPILRVYKSSIPTLNNNSLPAREPSDLMDEGVPLFTGDLYYGNMGWSTNGTLTISTSDVFPLQINGIFGTIEGGVK